MIVMVMITMITVADGNDNSDADVIDYYDEYADTCAMRRMIPAGVPQASIYMDNLWTVRKKKDVLRGMRS